MCEKCEETLGMLAREMAAAPTEKVRELVVYLTERRSFYDRLVDIARAELVSRP